MLFGGETAPSEHYSFLFETETNEETMWIFDGTPEDAKLQVRASNPDVGGHLVLIVLGDGSSHVVGTFTPARKVQSWSLAQKRAGAAPVVRVLVWPADVRYMSRKTKLLRELAMVPGWNTRSADATINLMEKLLTGKE